MKKIRTWPQDTWIKPVTVNAETSDHSGQSNCNIGRDQNVEFINEMVWCKTEMNPNFFTS